MADRWTSERERRLWRLTAVAVLGIAGTVAIVPTIAAALLDAGVITTLFWVGIWLVIATVVALSLGARPRGVEVGAWLGIAAVYLLLLLRLASAAERSHLIEYGVVAIFILEALQERIANGRPVRRPALVAIAAATTIGAIDEAVQWLLPNRVGTLVDVGFDLVAATLAVTAGVVLRRARRAGHGRDRQLRP